MNIFYHCKEWLSFWETNQNDTYGDDYDSWVSPVELAEIWYEEEYPEDDTFLSQTLWFSAGVFLGKEM
mgnify:CR=1 FL=1